VNQSSYDLRDTGDLDLALQDLRGFWKLWSGCLLTKCGLPTLQGFILVHPYQGAANLFRELGSQTVLVRHDKRLESPAHPRGGFLVGEELIEETIGFFFDHDRIVGIYEGADPLLNLHNMNVMFETDRDVWIDVVGPGFDASDLQRGDLSPHESFSVHVSPGGTNIEVTPVLRVDDTTYKESVMLRKDKIRKKLESAPSRHLARRIREELRIPEDLDAYLRRVGSFLLESQSYQPVSQDLLRDTVAQIVTSKVLDRYSSLVGVGFPLVFSTSLVNRGSKQVYWDIVSPGLKFEGLLKNKKRR
jgi:hypothetical protein